MQKCPSCKKRMPDYARYCAQCGHHLYDEPDTRDTTQPCPSCTERMPDYAHYCAQCGHQLNAAHVKLIKVPLSSTLQRHATDIPATTARKTIYHKVLGKLPRPLQYVVTALLRRAGDPEPEMVRASYAFLKTEATTNWGWLPLVALLNSLGVFSVAYAYTGARDGGSIASGATFFFVFGLLLIFVPSLIRLIAPTASRFERISLLCVTGIAFYLVNVMYSPLYFSYFDEFLHWRTVNDIVSTGHLFSNNTLLPVSPFFPGLEIVTEGLTKLSGLNTFISGTIVVGVARMIMVLALFLLYELITKSARIAGIAMILYMTNPHFLFFDTQFAYESLALPLATLVLYVIAQHVTHKNGRLRITLIACILLAAVAVTHHITDYIFDSFLLLWAILYALQRPAHSYPLKGRLRKSPLLWAALFGVMLSLLWMSFPGNPVVNYLSSAFEVAFNQLTRLLNGTGGGKQLFVTFSGQPTPLWERFLTISSVALLVFPLPFGLLCLWLRYRSNALVWMLGIVSLGYPVSQALRLTNAGAEIADRSSAFLFLAVACVLAIFIAQFWPTQWLNWKHTAVLTCALSIVFLGSLILGNGAISSILPGPYLVSADERSIEPEGIQSAMWASSYLGPNNRMTTDRINQLLMSVYGNQHLVTPTEDQIDDEAIFLSPTLSPYDIAVLQQAQVRYIVVDLRLSTALPFVGFYFNEGEPGAYKYTTPVSVTALTKFNTVPQINRVFDSGSIVLYDAGGLIHAP